MPDRPISDSAWLEATLVMARPQVVGALARHFRDIDKAEDAYQTACLRALSDWPRKARPHDPVAWLILVGRNAGIDALRRDRRFDPLKTAPVRDKVTDVEAEVIECLERSEYRDDILRLLFICSRPELPVSDQLALALKVVIGLSVPQIARAFLVNVRTMEQRITRAKRKAAAAEIGFEAPSASERAQRLAAVSAMLYLLFNEGYSSAGSGPQVRASLCEDAIRLLRLLLRLFPAESEVMGLLALCLFQNSRRKARHNAEGEIVLLEHQDRNLWNRDLIAEGQALLAKAWLKGRPGPYQIQAAIAAVHCHPSTAEATNWREIGRLYRVLEKMQPSPVVTLNRAVAVSKVDGPAAALAIIDPLAGALDGYLYFHGARARLLEQMGRKSEAASAYARALTLNPSAAEAAFLQCRLEGLG